MIINAENLILGRLASYAAKKALLGEKIEIVNCENVVITGSKQEIFQEYKSKIARGNVFKGPYFPRRADMIVRRTIRGMLPRKKARGREAYQNIKCYIGLPENLKNQNFISLDNANVNKLRSLKFVYIKDMSKMYGK